jgi:hypothetical protein
MHFLYLLPLHSWQTAIFLRSVRWPPTEPLTVTHARGHWWTLHFANALVSLGINSRRELVPSHGASRRRLGITAMCATDRLVSSFLATRAKHQGIDPSHLQHFFKLVFVNGLCSKYNYFWWDSTGFSLVIHQGCLHNVQVRISLYFIYNKANYKGNTFNLHLWKYSSIKK